MNSDETKENRNKVQKAIWILGDWFSQLGGSARYQNMFDSDVFEYVCRSLILRQKADIYWCERFEKHAESVLPKVTEIINSIPTTELRFELAEELYEYASEKLPEREQSHSWKSLKNEISATDTQ